MDKDATWHGGRLGPNHIVRWGPSFPPPTANKGHSSPSHFRNLQTCAYNLQPMSIVAKWLDGSKMPFYTEVGLGPGHIVLDGNPDPSQTGNSFSALTLLVGQHTGRASGLEWWGTGMVICLQSSWCHCHPMTSCSSKVQNLCTFMVPARRLTQVVLEKGR